MKEIAAKSDTGCTKCHKMLSFGTQAACEWQAASE